MKTVLQFSGGKDSLACLTLLEPRWPELIVVWVNTGAAFPETIALMDEIAAKVPHFHEIRSAQTVTQRGYPADVVPANATQVGRLMTGAPGQKFQSRIDCCGAALWVPMGAYMREIKPECIIRGQKLADRLRSPIRSGAVVEGIRYEFPLEDWTDAQVYAYLAANRVKLPKSYRWMMTGLDCWNCTAYLNENVGRMTYMRDHHPEKYHHVLGVLGDLDLALRPELFALQHALSE